MRTSRTGYLMAMAAGVAIVGAATGGVLAANSHHQATLAADQLSATPLAVTSAAAADPTAVDSTAADSNGSASTTPTSIPAGATSVTVPAPASGTVVPPTLSAATTSTTTSARAAAAPSAAKTSTAARPTPVSHKFKDGMYTATGSYNSPGGIERLGVTVTLAADKVTKSDLDLQGGAGLSHTFQSAFASAYSPQVIGKDINSISLGSVSGSSLTGKGFNDALQQIEAQARVQK